MHFNGENTIFPEIKKECFKKIGYTHQYGFVEKKILNGIVHRFIYIYLKIGAEGKHYTMHGIDCHLICS